MSIHSLSRLALPLAAALLLGMTGCSSDSSSTPVVVTDDTSGDTTSETYTGDKSLSGSFETFSSTAAAPARRAAARADGAASELVKLYVLDENGSLKDTGITCDVNTTTSTYECNDIAGDKEYIVRYVKDLGGGKVLELKSNVAVGDSDVTGAEVSRVTSLIVEAISKAVEEAIVGVAIDESKVTELIASVKDAIKTSISSLVQQGLIAIPSVDDMTVEASFEDVVGTAGENENLKDASGIIVSDDSVANALGSGKNDAKLLAYADMTKEQLVKEIFSQTMEDVPDWVVSFLAAKYDSVPATYTVGGFFSKVNFVSEGHDDDGTWNPDEWFTKQLEGTGVAAANQEALIDDIIDELNAKLDDGTAFANFKTEIETHYELKEKDVKTDEDYKELAEFPAIAEYLFPKTFVQSMEADTALQNIGQGIVLIAYAEGVLAKDVIKTKIEAEISGTFFEEQVENMYLVEINPEFIFVDMGIASELATYDILSIGWFEARTDKFWDETGEKEFLTIQADVERPSWMISGDVDASKLSATLTYPTATGVKTKELDVMAEGDWAQLRYSPWTECNGGICEPDTTKMDITDHVSGEYKITVTYDGETAEKTFKTFVLKGANDVRVKLISPNEMPQWPEELSGNNVDWSDPDVIALQDEHQNQMASYEITTFAVNNEANGTVDGVVFKWDDTELNKKIAALELPENIVPAYQVNIGLFNTQCTSSNPDECYTDIYNTWWNGRPITTTSFKLPIPLKENVGNEKYNIGVNVVFIDKETGDDVGQGGHAWAEFNVGTATQLNGSEKVIFNGTASAAEGSTMPTSLKVALMAERCSFNEETFVHTCTRTKITDAVAVSGDYTLSADVADIKAAMSEGKNVMLIAFEDRNSDGVFTDWDPSKTPEDNEGAEAAYWPYNKHFWFENWGDFIVGTSTCSDTTGDCTYDSVKVNPGDNVTVDNIDFEIWNYYSEPDQAGTASEN